MTIRTDALDEAVRRFPRLLSLAKCIEERDFNWQMLAHDVRLVREEYRRVVRDLQRTIASVM